MTLTADILARYGALGQADIDQGARDAARVALADGLAVMVAATGLEPAVRPFMDYAASSGAGPSTLLGAGRLVSPVMAALANGALAHAIDFEDTFEEGMIHPNASLIPSVLALAESEGAGGEDVVKALALGCDFACRLSLALDGDPARRGWYHPPIIAGLGAALGCSVLLGLGVDATRNALGLFAAQFMLADELKRSPRSDLRAIREGFAARAAVESALLARAGVEAVEQPLEGPSGVFRLLTGNAPLENAFADIGERFLGLQVGVKRWPACRGTHNAIVVAERLRARGISSDAIAQVTVSSVPPNDMLFVPRAQRIAPQTAIDAKFSIPFVLSKALEDGTVNLASFDKAQLQSPASRDFAQRVHFDKLLPAGSPEAIYEVKLADGAILAETVDTVPVWRAQTIALPDLLDKVRSSFAASGKSIDHERFLSAIAGIESDGIAPIMAIL